MSKLCKIVPHLGVFNAQRAQLQEIWGCRFSAGRRYVYQNKGELCFSHAQTLEQIRGEPGETERTEKRWNPERAS